jgi:LacI family transcriptional regulator
VRGNGRPDGGAAAAHTLLADGLDVTAVFAFNDQMATGAIGAFQRAGFRVPDDISVIGFDDIPHATSTYPALTTVAQPIAELAAVGVRLLLDRIARREAPWQRVLLETRLEVRESTGPPGVSRRSKVESRKS